MGRVSALVSSSARLGLSRLYGLSDYGSLPPRSRHEARATVATASQVRSTIDEYIQAERRRWSKRHHSVTSPTSP